LDGLPSGIDDFWSGAVSVSVRRHAMQWVAMAVAASSILAWASLGPSAQSAAAAFYAVLLVAFFGSAWYFIRR
jgi:hypothetical protein